jgi:hypothetical protein
MRKFIIPLTALFVLLATSAKAGVVPYPNIGTIAPTATLTASSTGEIIGEFVKGGELSGGTAGDTDLVRVVDITKGTHSDWLFDNQQTFAGTSADFLSVNAGDLLEIELENISLQDGNGNPIILSSIPTDSSDGLNHVYITSFSGGVLNGVTFSAGTYVGTEDLPEGPSDFNYADDTFVFQNLSSSSSATPEPGSFYLLGSGIAGLAAMLRRKLKA